MKKIAVALLFMTAAHTMAMSLWTGETLLKRHDAGQRMAAGSTQRQDVIDAFAYLAYVQGVIESHTSGTKMFCAPPGAESIDVSQKVVAKLRERQDLRALPAYITILGVAGEHWPCPAR